MRRSGFLALSMAALAGISLLGVGCKKEVPIDPVPFLKIEEVSPTTTIQFQENIDVLLTYQDQDGDLGFQNPDSFALEVLDSRLTIPDYYHVQPVAPPDQELSVRGTITLEINSPFILGNGTQEVVSYAIRIKDRAGNWSNTVVTPDITVNN
jgi:hypothetical protein